MIKYSISGRLALMFALASVLFVSVYGVLLRDSLHTSLQKQMHNELLFRSNLIEPWIASRTTDSSWHLLTDKLENLSAAEGDRVRYGFFSDNPSLNQEVFSLAELNWNTLGNGFSKLAPDREDSCSLFVYIAEVAAKEGRSAVRYVIAIDSTSYMGTLTDFTKTLIMITAIGVMLVASVGFMIAKIGLRPVKNLSSQAQYLLPGDDNQRLDTLTLPHELKDLASSFNGVLARQAVAWRQLESFNADVAHELRTPLTNLIGQTQLGLSHKHDIYELQELLGSNLEELERMASIVNDMLFLSHAQAGEYATQRTEVSVNTEAQKTVEYIEPLLADKGLQVKVGGDVTACIDHRLFHRALANLLSNSARYAYPNSTVTVAIKQKGDIVSVAVSNHGESIADEQLERLFERFYRIDSSRSSSHTHHGLGLSIVRAVALMHKGNVFASSNDGTNTFGLTLAVNNLTGQ